LNVESIKVTGRGLALAYAVITLTLLSIVSRDPVLAIVAAPLALTLALDLVALMLRARGECRVELDRGELRLHLGDRVEVNGRIKCGDVIDVMSSGLLRVKGLKRGSQATVSFEVEGLHVGSYEVTGVDVLRVTPLGTLTFTSRAPIRLNVRVTPRAAYLLALAYEVLAGGGPNPGLSELESIVRSDSGVYVYTREYMPGDSLRRVDWKATARRLRFMVKEYRLELGSLGLLALDLRCLGERTCDDIASAALLIAIGLPVEGRINVLELDTGRLLEMGQRELLAYTISRILEPEIAGRLDLQEYVPPPTLGELQRIALKLGYKTKAKNIQASTQGATAILTTLLVENRKTLEVVEKARSRGDTTIIVTPRKPWLDMGSLEQAYIAYTTYTKTAAKIKNMGAELYTCCPPTKL
jgi:hypothetical protein